MATPENSSRPTWRTFVTGRGARDLPAHLRLLVDLASLGAAVLAIVVLMLLWHDSRPGWGYPVGFGGVWLVLAMTRYWRHK